MTFAEGFWWHCQLICRDTILGRRRGSLTSSLFQAARAGVVISYQSRNPFRNSWQ